MATTVGELNVRLNLELQRLDAQISQANAKIARMGKSWHADVGKAARAINATLATIGAGASLSGLIAYGKSCLDLGGRITDLASQANLSVVAFQNMELAAMENGTTGEEVAAVFAKLGNAIQDAVEDPAGKAAKAFDKLRLGASALKDMEGPQVYELLGRSIANAADKQEAYNALADILGQKIGPKQLQLLQAIAEVGYDKIAEGNKKLVMTPEQIKALDEASDAWERLGRNLTVFGGRLIIGFEYALNPSEAQKLANEYASVLAGGNEGADARFFRWLFGTNEEFEKRAKEREEKLKEIRARLYDLTNPSGSGLSTDPVTLAAESRARAAAEANEIAAINLEVTKATAEANKQAEAAMKDRAAADEKYFDAMRKQDAELNAIAEATLRTIDPSREYAAQIEDINRALAANKLRSEEAAAAIDKIRAASVDAQLEDFFGSMDKKSAENMERIAREAERGKDAARQLGMTFSSAFEDAIVDGKKLSDVLGGLADDLLRLALRKNITEPLFASLFSSEKSGGSGGGILGAIGGLFGGFFADGGRPSQGKVSFVGEEGIEAFVPDSAGTIVSNDRLREAIGGGGGGISVSIVQKFEAGVTPAQLADGLRQTYEAAKSGVMDAIQRRRGGFGALSAA